MRRTAQRIIPSAPHEVLLVMDATTGQNGLQQARLFTESAGVTGIVLTKLDGTAKGGIAVAIARELKVPSAMLAWGRSWKIYCLSTARLSSIPCSATRPPCRNATSKLTSCGWSALCGRLSNPSALLLLTRRSAACWSKGARGTMFWWAKASMQYRPTGPRRDRCPQAGRRVGPRGDRLCDPRTLQPPRTNRAMRGCAGGRRRGKGGGGDHRPQSGGAR